VQGVRLDDPSATLTSDQRSALQTKLVHMGQAGNTTGISIMRSLNGESIDTIAQKTFSEWQLGDRGVLVLLAMDDHICRIETGE
jgi:uncharacterized membrane protein YgcG